MNSTYDPLTLVNSYGAFGSISRTREEVVLEGTSQSDLSGKTVWAEYEFKGKPGDVGRMPRQWGPYHLRLDWMMWFLSISPAYAQPWLIPLCHGLLTNEPSIVRLLRTNPSRTPRPLTYGRRCTGTASALHMNSCRSASGGSGSESARTLRRYLSTRRGI